VDPLLANLHTATLLDLAFYALVLRTQRDKSAEGAEASSAKCPSSQRLSANSTACLGGL
jgi:hypothetical protein